MLLSPFEVFFVPYGATIIHETKLARSVVLVGLMGAGKTSIGRRLASKLNLPFRDADAEIELAAGCSIPDIFARYGESAFRDGERRVIQRLLAGDPLVLAFGGGAFIDPEIRALTRQAAVSVWLRCPLATLLRRVASRDNRPLLNHGDHEVILRRLMRDRYPIYAEADVIVDCDDNTADQTTVHVMQALSSWNPPRRINVSTISRNYDIIVGRDLLSRAGAILAPSLPAKKAVIISDANVGRLYLAELEKGLRLTGISSHSIIIPGGEHEKSLHRYTNLLEQVLSRGVDRQTAVIALGGGVVGDLAGFVAATTLRGVPFVQAPTTLLSQVDSSIGGKTGVNTPYGKNLVGAFYQPTAVLSDTRTLGSLPRRELLAGYAEIVKLAFIGSPDFFEWCDSSAVKIVAGDETLSAEAIIRACEFKASIVKMDELEQMVDGGRALLNFGHTFAHALEATSGYSNVLLHGEAVAIGMALAFTLSVKLGHCSQTACNRAIDHLKGVGFDLSISRIASHVSASALISKMMRDKKVRGDKLMFVLARDIGQAFVSSDVPINSVNEVLRANGCET